MRARPSQTPSPTSARPARPAPPGLPRWLDLLLAAVLLLPVLPVLALVAHHWWATSVQGAGGRPFRRWSLVLPVHRGGRLLRALGFAQVPVLFNILRGDMAWVGPRPRHRDEPAGPVSERVRPGLFNPWFIRRRTAAHWGSEAEADRQYLAHRGRLHDLGLLLRGALASLLPAPTAATPGRVQIVDVAYDNLTMAQALDRLDALLDGDRPHQVSFVNAACVNIAARHRGYRRALARAALVLPDGIGIKIGSLLLGKTMQQNVNGTDLFPRWCDRLAQRRTRLYLLGGSAEVVAQTAEVIAFEWPGVQLVGHRDGFFGLQDEGQVVADIRASGADVLLVARGVPSQDLFIDRYLPQLGVKVAMGVGGLFDFVSGRIPRAPLWMRESGLEWVWRLAQEPTRLWQRYLIGNPSFLGRVLMQAVGLRRPATDGHPPSAVAAVPAAPGVHAVIFATPRVAADQPLPADHLTALLPLGCQTLIERLLQQVAEAGIADVHLVVCDRPDLLRAVLGDGSRWGLRLHWHLVKDALHPYGVLDRQVLRRADRLLIGHADRCPSSAAVRQLVAADQWLVDVGDARSAAWSGWASLPPSWLPPRCAPLDADGLDAVSRRGRWPQRLHPLEAGTSVVSAAGLLSAQAQAREVPGSWIQRPWGAMSPLAQVDEQAELVGPLRIGPGCVVEKGARIGPGVVLSRDVVVSAGSQLSHCVVLPGSYIGADLTLADAVVNGPRVRHLRLGVEARLAESDALLMHLNPKKIAGSSWLGRAAAAGVLAGVGPLLLLHTLGRRLRGRGPAWHPTRAVLGPQDGRPGLRELTLRDAAPGASRGERAWALAAGLLDVLQGRRCWIGVRPRTSGEWYALRPEWQSLLANRPIGLLHAPAWYDNATLEAEANAAADVFAVVLPPWRRTALVLGSARRVATVR